MSNNILDILNSNLTSDVIGQLSNQIGADKDQTSTATQGAVNILLAAMNKNARQPEKAAGLLSALQNDHNGGIFDSIMDLASGNTQNINNRTANGAGILGHLLGSKQGSAVEMLAKMSGLDTQKSGSLLSTLAPIVMGAVGKQMSGGSQSGTGGLMDILSNTMNSRVQNQKEQSMLEKLIDQDNDGSVIDDILNFGMSFLRRK